MGIHINGEAESSYELFSLFRKSENAIEQLNIPRQILNSNSLSSKYDEWISLPQYPPSWDVGSFMANLKFPF
jgi:hypothetical protein